MAGDRFGARTSPGARVRPVRALVVVAALLAAFAGGCGVALPSSWPTAEPATASPSVYVDRSEAPIETDAIETANPTPKVTAAPTKSGVIFSDSFESLSAWDVSSYVYAPWVLDTSIGATDAPCAAFGPYLHNEEAKMGHVVSLPAGKPITLRYSAWYQTEPDFDELIIWIHTVGKADWDSLASQSGSSGGKFKRFTVDLSRYAGRNVEVVFGFRSDARNAVSGGGVRVDDVVITAGG